MLTNITTLPMTGWIRAAILLTALFEIRSSVSQSAEVPSIQLFRPGNIPEGLDLHGSAVVGKRLYIFGGKKATAWNKEAWSGEIMPDTTIKNWRTEEALPELRTHIADLVQVVDNRIYIVGGLEPMEESLATKSIQVAKDILWTRVGPDGALEPWQHAGELKVRHGATVATDAGLFVFGGMVGGSITEVIRYTPFGTDGAPGPLREVGKLPTPLYYQGAAYMDKHLCIWGGRTTTSSADMNDAVYSAPLSADGTVGSWTVESRVPVPVCRAGFLGFNDYVVSVGGFVAGGGSKDGISFARLDREAKLGPWVAVKSDMESLMYHSVAVDKDRNAVFITGGRVKDANQKLVARNVITTIQAFALPAPTEKRIEIKPATAGASASFSSELPAALPILDAIKLGKAQDKQVVIFFYSPQVPACRRAWENVINTTTFAKLTSNYVFTAIDSTGPESGECYKFNVFRVPAILVVKPDGTFDRPFRIESERDVHAALNGG